MPATVYQVEIRLSDALTIRRDLPNKGGRIGSADDCELRIDDKQFPSQWLRVTIDGDQVALSRLDASTKVTRVPIGHWCVLAEAHVRVVPSPRTTFQTLVLSRRLDEALAREPDAGWADPSFELLDDDPLTPTRFAVTEGQVITIGRTKSKCDVVLPDRGDQISRHHATLEWRDDVPILRDHSINGTFWSRPSQDESFRGISKGQPLHDGDLIRIGSCTLRFRWPRAAMAEQLAHVAPRTPRKKPAASAPRAAPRINWLFWCASGLALMCAIGIVWLAYGP